MNKEELTFALCPMSNQAKWELINEFETVDGIWNNIYSNEKNKRLEKLKEYYDSDYIKETKKYLDSNDMKISIYKDENYPRKLCEISDAPPVLFYRGDINILDDMKSIAIVGARNCTSYGEDFTKVLMNYLSNFEVNIISGGAMGVDSLSHRYALKYGLKTTAVFGCGIDVVYPKSNYKLFKDIAENGVLLSEFHPGTKPFSYNFPIRNRIISGLSSGVIAVEGGENSGTMITAKEALNQGKIVFALPGSFFSKNSVGCNKIIKEGAIPIVSMEDIALELGLEKKKNIKSIRDKNRNKIFNIISDNPISIDELIRLGNIDITMLYELLFELQLDNSILCLSGNYYVRNI